MFLHCEGTITIEQSQLASCSTAWSDSVGDLTALMNQLASLNDFNPVVIASMISFWCVMFTLGFGGGLVLRNLRRI